MDEKELANVRQKMLEIAQREKGTEPRLTQEAVSKLNSDKLPVKSSQSRLR
jgi:hypothetical protein